jgi:hypothetical protein
MLPTQQPFPLDGLRQVRLAARRAKNPFFGTALVHEPYSRAVFLGRGLLFVARQTALRPDWRTHLAFFVSLPGGAWLTLLPHSHAHVSAEAACQQAEELAARMHTTTWQRSLGLFAARQAEAA